jgi:excisionase family DNA binding protein
MNFNKLLTELDDAPDSCADEVAASIVNKVSEWAVVNGRPDLVREWTPAAQRVEVRRYLAQAIQGNQDADSLLTVKQAADRLQVSQTVIRDACMDGRLKHTRYGRGRGTIRIATADLEDFKKDMQGGPKLRLRHLA